MKVSYRINVNNESGSFWNWIHYSQVDCRMSRCGRIVDRSDFGLEIKLFSLHISYILQIRQD